MNDYVLHKQRLFSKSKLRYVNVLKNAGSGSGTEGVCLTFDWFLSNEAYRINSMWFKSCLISGSQWHETYIDVQQVELSTCILSLIVVMLRKV